LQGQAWKLNDCSVKQYWQSHQSADLLHLATHAVVDSTDADLSYIGMADGELIYSFEIANQSLSPQMVTLSACESSRGKSIPGEAELSLARSYFQAGSQAVIASLWPVNDESTAQIMVKFYEELKEGIPKDQALRLAKEHYVDNADPAGRHPYYWAGFVAIGDMSPLTFKNNKGGLWLWIGLLVTVLLIGQIFRISEREIK